MPDFIKRWASPAAILAGILLYRILEPLSFLIPALLFGMIFITCCVLDTNDVTFQRVHLALLISQIVTGLVIYFIVINLSSVTAEAMLICVMAPTAISATVVAAMIGADIASLTLYTLMGNMITALLLPFLLPLLGIADDIAFFLAFWFILRQLFFMLIAPLILALLFYRFLPYLHTFIRKHHAISFYLYIISFAIVISRSMKFFLAYGEENIPLIVSVIAGSFMVFILQFRIGRTIGFIYGDSLTGGQAMGHKNTVLAIWIAQSYMQPLASIGPTAYILWQAVFNSWQVWRYQRKR